MELLPTKIYQPIPVELDVNSRNKDKKMFFSSFLKNVKLYQKKKQNTIGLCLLFIYFRTGVKQGEKLRRGCRYRPPPWLDVSLHPRCRTQSGPTESKMARLIYRQCSHPITDGQDQKYALQTIKSLVRPVKSAGRDDFVLQIRVLFPVSCHKLSIVFPTDTSLSICFAA